MIPIFINFILYQYSRYELSKHFSPLVSIGSTTKALFLTSFFKFLGDPLGQTTLDSRLRYDAYSPHHQLTMTASGHHLRSGGDNGTGMGHQNINGSPCRSPGGVENSFTKIDSHNR